jgi:hypothetical protein
MDDKTENPKSVTNEQILSAVTNYHKSLGDRVEKLEISDTKNDKRISLLEGKYTLIVAPIYLAIILGCMKIFMG